MHARVIGDVLNKNTHDIFLKDQWALLPCRIETTLFLLLDSVDIIALLAVYVNSYDILIPYYSYLNGLIEPFYYYIALGCQNY